MCIQLEIINKCRCYWDIYENINSNQTRSCLNLTDYNCINSVYYQVDPIKCATDYCPLECDSIHYDLTLSSLFISSMSDYNSLSGVSSSISYQEYLMQTVKIVVYYPQLEFTQIEETPAMSVASLIANLGGTLGLIVSFSFFTLIEIGELLILILHGLLSSIDTRKVSNKNQEN